MQYNRFSVKSLLRGEAVILQKRYRKGMRFIFLAEPFGAPVFEVVRVCDEPCAVEEQNAHKAEQHHADKDREQPVPLQNKADRRCCCKQKIPVLHTGT